VVESVERIRRWDEGTIDWHRRIEPSALDAAISTIRRQRNLQCCSTKRQAQNLVATAFSMKKGRTLENIASSILVETVGS
jgi:hypothetical protein